MKASGANLIRVHHILQGAVTGVATLHSDESHYVAHVRRAKVGQTVQLFDGDGRIAHTEITEIATDRGRSRVAVRVEQVDLVARPSPQLTAVIPLIKGDRFETCLEKLTEVGVDHVVIWLAERAVVQLDGAKLSTRLPRWRSTLTSAARQARCTHTPTLTGPCTLAQLTDLIDMKANTNPTLGYVLDPNADQSLMQSAIRSPHQPGGVVVLTGPEGGITATERDALCNADFLAVKLGTNVLRAETAPVIAIALLRLQSQG
jgi:16S rRNA (uracil1498-N3)-methyltransferase